MQAVEDPWTPLAPEGLPGQHPSAPRQVEPGRKSWPGRVPEDSKPPTGQPISFDARMWQAGLLRA